MAHEVYANGRNISSKAAGGKSIACFPDVCFTPAPPPPGVPVPYPNTGMASDTAKGSKSVKIGGKEIILKNQSHFKTSTGDEAGSAPKKGVVTAKIKGKVYFTSWSMDVKVEGKNACRHMDTTTHNHGSQAGNTAPWPYADKQAVDPGGDCKDNKKEEEESCKEFKPQGDKDPCPGSLANPPGKLKGDAVKAFAETTKNDADNDPCVQARKCKLVPYDAEKDGINGCCPGQTPHHVIPKSSFYKVSVEDGQKLPGVEGYDMAKAPCICLEGTNNTHGSHGAAHAAHKRAARKNKMKVGQLYPYEKHIKVCSEAVHDVAPHCSQKCIEKQVESGHKDAKVSGNPDIKNSPSGRSEATDDMMRAAMENKNAAPKIQVTIP